MKEVLRWVTALLVAWVVPWVVGGGVQQVVALWLTGDDLGTRISTDRLAVGIIATAGCLTAIFAAVILIVHIDAPGALGRGSPNYKLADNIPTWASRSRRHQIRHLAQPPWDVHSSLWSRAIWWAVAASLLVGLGVGLFFPDAMSQGTGFGAVSAFALFTAIGVIREIRAARFESRGTLIHLVNQTLYFAEEDVYRILQGLTNASIHVRTYIMQEHNGELQITWATGSVTPDGCKFRVRRNHGAWGEAYSKGEASRGYPAGPSSPGQAISADELRLLPRGLKHVWAAPIGAGLGDEHRCVGILVVDTTFDLEAHMASIPQSSRTQLTPEYVEAMLCTYTDQLAACLAILDNAPSQ